GLVDTETFGVGTTSLSRLYGYSSQRFMASASDGQASYGYGFDIFGLSTSVTKNGTKTTISQSGSTLTARGVTYTFEALGRTIKRGSLTFTYGPDGQMATASNGTTTWSFKYDELGQRILKLTNGAYAAGYFEEGYLDATGLTERLRIAGRTVGTLK